MSCCYSANELDSYSAFEEKNRTRLDPLSIPQSGGGNVNCLSYCLIRGHLLATARGRSLAAILNSSLHVWFRNYQPSLTRRARAETKKVNDHSRLSVNTRDVSEGSMGVTDTLGPAYWY